MHNLQQHIRTGTIPRANNYSEVRDFTLDNIHSNCKLHVKDYTIASDIQVWNWSSRKPTHLNYYPLLSWYTFFHVYKKPTLIKPWMQGLHVNLRIPLPLRILPVYMRLRDYNFNRSWHLILDCIYEPGYSKYHGPKIKWPYIYLKSARSTLSN